MRQRGHWKDTPVAFDVRLALGAIFAGSLSSGRRSRRRSDWLVPLLHVLYPTRRNRRLVELAVEQIQLISQDAEIHFTIGEFVRGFGAGIPLIEQNNRFWEVVLFLQDDMDELEVRGVLAGFRYRFQPVFVLCPFWGDGMDPEPALDVVGFRIEQEGQRPLANRLAAFQVAALSESTSFFGCRIAIPNDHRTPSARTFPAVRQRKMVCLLRRELPDTAAFC